ncbi:biofilm development regulator YmgB/AriR family protein [Pantoea sp. App145]|uniref:biofilm development regulator YmgB/AriR family protein n=1 Tax=Pantoea sp. App145 TaxID=3071567 RepID=UPI003A802766
MPQAPEVETNLQAFFHQTDPNIVLSETEWIDAAVLSIETARQHATNKDIILWLIAKLETSHDALQQDALRNALEIVVAGTPDDPES